MNQKVPRPPMPQMMSPNRTVFSPRLETGFTTPKRPALVIGSDADRSFIFLTLDELKKFDKNPRTVRNPAHDDIKESIRAAGKLDQAFTVTKRPHENFYILAAGGNTRLDILNELYQETKNEDFYRNIPCFFKNYTTEQDLILAHIGENELRGEMCFWDKAKSMMAIQAELKLTTPNLSSRAFEEYLKNAGMKVSSRTLRMYEFSVQYLSVFNLACPLLTFKITDELREGLLLRHQLMIETYREFDAFFKQFAYEAWTKYARSAHELQMIDVPRALGLIDVQLCELFTVSQERLSSVLALLNKNKDLNPAAAMTQLKSTEVLKSPSTTPNSVNQVNSHRIESQENVVSQEVDTVAPTSNRVHSIHESGTTEPVHHNQYDVHVSTLSTPASDLSFMDLVHQFAVDNQLSDELVINPKLPMGFYVELPNRSISDELSAYCAWWLLARMSSQELDAVCLELPDESQWKRLTLESKEQDDITYFNIKESMLGTELRADLLLDWLQHPETKTETYFQLLMKFKALNTKNT
jgi:hypothetical protein